MKNELTIQNPYDHNMLLCICVCVCTERTLGILPFTNKIFLSPKLYANLDTTGLNGPWLE